jgi:hypothetical protein
MPRKVVAKHSRHHKCACATKPRLIDLENRLDAPSERHRPRSRQPAHNLPGRNRSQCRDLLAHMRLGMNRAQGEKLAQGLRTLL